MERLSRLIDFLENPFGRGADVLIPIEVESSKSKSVKERIKRELEYV